MPARVIRGEINASRSLARVSLEADLTFRALIVAVDDFGRMEADPLMLKAALFPRREAVKPAKAREWVEELAADGCLQIYRVDGVEYLQLTGWETHRGNTRRQQPKHPPPPGLPDAASVLVECVYFVESGERIKIGWTGNLKARLETIRTYASNAQLIGIVRGGDRALEKRLHRQFDEHRSDGEWFSDAPVIRQWISENTSPDIPDRPVTPQDGQLCPAGVERGSREKESGVGGAPKVARARSARGQRAPQLPPPADLEPSELEALEVWVRGTLSRPDMVPRIKHLVAACLTHHRAKGNTMASWYAAAQSWITREAEERYGKARALPSTPVESAYTDDDRDLLRRAQEKLRGAH